MNQFRQMAVDMLKETPIKPGLTGIFGEPISEEYALRYFEEFFRRSAIQNKLFEALKQAGLNPTATQSLMVFKALCKRGIKLDVVEYEQPATFRGS